MDSRIRFEQLEDRCLLAIAPELIKDINTTEAGSMPNGLVSAGEVAYFRALGDPGDGLWRTDGTAAGTELLFPSQPAYLTVLGDRLFFTADDAEHGYELRVTDGTAPGTRLVKDITPGWQDSVLGELTVIGDLLYFTAIDPVAGQELWRSDGTAEGTWRVSDVRPGVDSSSPSYLFDYRGQVVFVADDGEHGDELWLSGGVAADTRLWFDLNPGPEGSEPESGSGARAFAVLNDALYFGATDAANGGGLWRYDPRQGFERVADLLPTQIMPLADALLIVAGDWNAGFDLWRFDGTQLTRLRTEAASSWTRPLNFAALDGALYFMATPETGGELWRTDGTPEGARRVQRFDHPGALAATGSRLFITEANDVGERWLWTLEAEAEAATLVRHFAGPTGNQRLPYEDRGVALGDTFLFVADDGLTGAELWRSSGDAGWTRIVADLARRTLPSAVWMKPLQVGRYIYFLADGGGSFAELWRTDGSAEGTVKLAGDPREGFSHFTAVGDTLYFLRHSRTEIELWRSDGDVAGTTFVHSIGGSWNAYEYFSLTASGDALFFLAFDPLAGFELWRTDPSSSGAALVRDIRPGPDSAFEAEHIVFAAGANGSVYFAANDGETGRELWFSDGSTAGTRRVIDLEPGPTSSDLTKAIWWRDQLVFLATVGSTTGLWAIDGTGAGARLLLQVHPAPFRRIQPDFTAAGNYLFFVVPDDQGKRQLWRTDGSAAGTVALRTLDLPTYGDRDSSPMVELNGLLYFVGDDEATGRELWRSDGTTAGTQLVADLAPGPAPGWPDGLTVVGETLFFRGDAPQGSAQLWRSDGTPSGTESLQISLYNERFAAVGRTLIVWSDASAFADYEPYSLTPPPGDTNYDGLVDPTDFGRLKDSFGVTGDSLAADFDRNGAVDLADFGLLKENFGRAGSLASEPRDARAGVGPAIPASGESRGGALAAIAASFSPANWIEAVAYQLAWTLVAREQASLSSD